MNETQTPTAEDLAREIYMAGPETLTIEYRPDGIAELIDGDRKLIIGDETTSTAMGDDTDGDLWGWTWTTYERATDPYDGEYWEEMSTTSHPAAEEDDARTELAAWAAEA